jgi:rod shape determining protein RodA
MADLPMSRALRPGTRSRANRLEPARLLRCWDPMLLGAVLALALAGALSVYAATRNSLITAGVSPTYYLKRDLENLALGAVILVFVRLVRLPTLKAVALVLHAGACLLLLAVLVPGIGSDINGAHAWFSFGSFELEPSEFVKITTILVVAALLSERTDNETTPSRRSILLSLAAIGVPLLLILLEPALGIAIMVALITPVLLALAGVRARWLVALLMVGALGVTGIVEMHLLKPYQEARFTAFVNPTAHSNTTGYHEIESEIAVGSGRLFGQGFLKGSQTNGRFIPEQDTDFVFTVTAEEAGLAGSGALLLLFTIVFWRGLRIAARAPDPFGRMVAGAIVWWFAVQAFINIGMTVGLMPVTGLPLPFVSYGGSSMFADCAAVGLLLAIARSAEA